MHFAEREQGDFRIYAGAIEARRTDGYHAAVIVHRVRGVDDPVEAWRDDNVCGGYVWPTADEALSFAMRKASTMIRSLPRRVPVELPAIVRAALESGRGVGRRTREAATA
jgi:hypothetical protein